MNEQQIREIIRDELKSLFKSDRYLFEKLIQISDGRNIQLGTTTGSMLGTATTQKIGFLGKTPVARQSAPATLADVITVLQTFGFTA